MKSVLITGAHGFIGRHLARLCHSRWQAGVIGLGHGTFSGSELRAWGMQSSLNGDVNFSNLQRAAAETALPDVVFHLAGGNSVAPSLRVPQEDFRRTVASTCELLEWVRTHSPRTIVVVASSAAVYGAGHSLPIADDAPVHPFSPYGYHKRMAEMLCESYSNNFGLTICIARFFSVYGPELRKQLLWDTCQRMAAGEQRLLMQGTGKETRDWLHVSDAVQYLLTIAENATRGLAISNCGTGVATSVRSVVQFLASQWSDEIQVEFTGKVRPGDPVDLVARSRPIDGMKWRPEVGWQQGMAEYVEWFRKHVDPTVARV